jgi:hypothetical protein
VSETRARNIVQDFGVFESERYVSREQRVGCVQEMGMSQNLKPNWHDPYQVTDGIDYCLGDICIAWTIYYDTIHLARFKEEGLDLAVHPIYKRGNTRDRKYCGRIWSSQFFWVLRLGFNVVMRVKLSG